MRTRQLTFHEFERFRASTSFGGTLLKGHHPRGPRPICPKRPLHLVLRSSIARGDRSLLRHRRVIHEVLMRIARRHGVRIYRLANAGNHLHLIVRARTRTSYRAFVRGVTGVIARIILRSAKGRPSQAKAWDTRPFTRILEWGADFRRTCDYLLQNQLETFGLIPYQPRKNRDKPPP